MMSAGTGTRVDYGLLEESGNFYIAKADEMDDSLDLLNQQQATIIESAWQDDNGHAFSTGFGEFFTDAKNINADVRALGNDAVKFAVGYRSIEEAHASRMGDY